MTRNVSSNHFLQNFFYSREPFAVIASRLYTLNKTNGNFNGEDAFHLLGRRYVLDESEEISQLEKSLFLDNHSEIERTMTDYIKTKFIDRIEKNKASLNETQNYYSSMQDTTIEKFIMIDVFNKYNHENRGVVDDKVKTNDVNNLPEKKYPGVEDLISKENSLNILINSKGFVVVGNKCYALYENGGKRNEKDGYIVFRKNICDLKLWISLEDLCEGYTKKLDERINQKAAKHGEQFTDILMQIDREKEKVGNAIKQRRSISEKTQDKRGEIGFRKLGDRSYEISITIPPYIIEKNNSYYSFGTVKLETTIEVRNNQIKIDHRPKVLNMPYLHPFVWPDSKICYGEPPFNWQKDLKVNFNSWYNLSNRKEVAEKIARVMHKGKQIIESGYRGVPRKDFTPLMYLEECNCKIADNRRDAERYARTYKIPIERIKENP